MVLGHEGAGIIKQTGDQVTKFKMYFSSQLGWRLLTARAEVTDADGATSTAAAVNASNVFRAPKFSAPRKQSSDFMTLIRGHLVLVQSGMKTLCSISLTV